MTNTSIFFLIAIVFISGFGWGRWYAERSIRREQTALSKNKLLISVPMHEDVASKTLGMLKNIVEQVESENNDH